MYLRERERERERERVCIKQPIHTSRMSFFEQSLSGLNSEISFSQTSYHDKIKEPILPDYLLIAERSIVWLITFSKGISTMGNANSLI